MLITNAQKQSVYISAMLVAVALAVTGVTVFLLYNIDLQERQQQLRETAQGQARLIEAIARYDRQHAIDSGEEYLPEVTLGQVRDAHKNFRGFGDTGEFVLAKREGDQIVFLLNHRHYDLDQPQPVSFESNLAEPMRLALQGKAGTIFGQDYRGHIVMAAYEPVSELNYGIVAKLDMAEVRAPFIQAGILALAVTFFLALAGGTFFQRFTSGMLRRIEESEDRLQTAISGTSDGLWLWNIQSDAEWHAPQWKRLLGYDEDEALPDHYQTWESRIHPDDRERVLEALEQHLEQGVPYDCAHRLRTKSGEFRWFRDRGEAIRDTSGQAIKMGGSIQDITDLQQAEEKLRTLSRAMEQAGEAIIITDAAGVIEYINPAFTRLTQYAEGDVLGKTAWIARKGQGGEMPYGELWKRVSDGQTWQGKIDDRKKDGQLFPSMLTISPIVNEWDEITHFVGIQQDLTKYESLEAQLRQSQKMEAIGVLVGGIAHNFNNALAGITGNLFLAKNGARELPDVVAKLDNVEKLSFHAAEMIQHLLTFARKSMVQRRTICINALCQEAVSLTEVTLSGNIRLNYDIPDERMFVYGDKAELQQALINLINNAQDAVGNVAGPVISVDLKRYMADDAFLEQYADIAARDFACISISDNGPGIELENIEHIFEPFFTTKEVGKGTGLGLSMVYGAVQASNGIVCVDSDGAGQGATFRIYLPLQQVGQVAEKKKPAATVSSGQDELVLWADDERDVLNVGESVLKALNYRVLTALDGHSAIEKYQEYQKEIDLVILDVIMPGMGGFETLQELRKINPEVKAIFATGYDKIDLLGGRPDFSSEVVLSKPFTMANLSQAIRLKLDGDS